VRTLDAEEEVAAVPATVRVRRTAVTSFIVYMMMLIVREVTFIGDGPMSGKRCHLS